MKIKHSPTVLLLSLLTATAVMAEDAKVPATATPAQTAPAALAASPYTNTQLAQEFGWYLAKRQNLGELGFTPEETEAFVKGLGDACAGKEAPYDYQKILPALKEFVQSKQVAAEARMKEKATSAAAANNEAATAFFLQLKDNKAVVELPSGLRYEILKPGTGDYPKRTDTVKVKYKGTLLNGTVFDSTEIHNGEPAEFPLDKVIPGWTEGLQKINKGGSIRLYVPANLGYGDAGSPPSIPPASALIFEVELLDITPAAPASPAK